MPSMLPGEAIAHNRAVRARMLEYLGGSDLRATAAVFLSRCDVYTQSAFEARLPADLDFFLENGLDVGRSLWDRESFLAHFDLDYFNFDSPAEAYYDRQRIFRFMEPVAGSMGELLEGYGISPLRLITGRGCHFVWRFSREAPFFSRLVEWGQLPPETGDLCRQPCSPTGETVPLELTRAFVGLGRIMEWLAQEILRDAAGRTELPLRITSTEVAPGERGREIVCIDISAFGDPLHTRVIRLPFSAYGKPREKRDIPSPEVDGRIPDIFCIPQAGMKMAAAVALMQDVEQVIDLAGRVSVRIPDHSEAMEALVAAYVRSDLKRFHDRYYAETPEAPAGGPQTCDRFDPGGLPPCIGRLFDSELLLKAAALQLVVRTLLASDWHPRRIAGLIRSRYERYRQSWPEHWQFFNPAIRADFYGRLFAGLLATGLDDLADFTCRATRDKGYCTDPAGGCDLERFRRILLEKAS
jgi:hypothetical protein